MPSKQPTWSTLALSSGQPYDGAKQDRFFADWNPNEIFPEDAWGTAGSTLAARGADLSRNNPYYAAICNALESGVIGPEGLKFKSKYRIPNGDAGERSEEEQQSRLDHEEMMAQAIDRAIQQAIRGKSPDARGLLTWRNIQATAIRTKGTYGDVFLQKVHAPTRPGRHTHAITWRFIHPSRCQTPESKAKDDLVRNGIKYSADGTPMGAYFIKQGGKGYVYIPFYDNRGLPLLLWDAARLMPEQTRGIPWVAPCMRLLKQLGGVIDAHVAAKRLQASMGLIVEVDNPKKAAAADSNGEALSPCTKIQPGKVYYVRKGANFSPLNFSYQGQDFEDFTNQLLQAVCAGFGPGMPYQYALQQLTKSNLASSRAALMQAWRAFRGEQSNLIQNILNPMVLCWVDEDLSRGRLDNPDQLSLEDYASGTWLRPPRLSTDDYRDMQASKLAVELGASESTALADHDMDFVDEQEQKKRDQNIKKKLGLSSPAPAETTEEEPETVEEEEEEGGDDE